MKRQISKRGLGSTAATRAPLRRNNSHNGSSSSRSTVISPALSWRTKHQVRTLQRRKQQRMRFLVGLFLLLSCCFVGGYLASRLLFHHLLIQQQDTTADDSTAYSFSKLIRGQNQQQQQQQQQPWRQQQQRPKTTTQDGILTTSLEPHQSPLLIFTYQRANYLRETLTDVLKYIPNDCSMGCPVIVSQDGHDAAVKAVIAEFARAFAQGKPAVPVIHWVHDEESDPSLAAAMQKMDETSLVWRALRQVLRFFGIKLSSESYVALSKHYEWALTQVFNGRHLLDTDDAASQKAQAVDVMMLPAQRVLILEEDLHIAPDFFAYFTAMAPVLDHDPSLLAVSSFNDNGFENTVHDTQRVLRTDFFPGLGWMMTRTLWETEMWSGAGKSWAPEGYWDDWLRKPAQRQGRHVLRPEVSRTYHFGVEGGASRNWFGDYLTRIYLNTDASVSWEAKPLNDNSDSSIVDGDQHHWSHYLQSEEAYDRQYWNLIQSSKLVETSFVEDALQQCGSTNVRLEYTSVSQLKKFMKQLHLMDDIRSGVARTAYKGVIETRPPYCGGGSSNNHHHHFLFLTPPLQYLHAEFTHHHHRQF